MNSSTSSVDQQHHLSLFGVFLQDSLDLKKEIHSQLSFLVGVNGDLKSVRSPKLFFRRFSILMRG